MLGDSAITVVLVTTYTENANSCLVFQRFSPGNKTWSNLGKGDWSNNKKESISNVHLDMLQSALKFDSRRGVNNLPTLPLRWPHCSFCTSCRGVLLAKNDFGSVLNCESENVKLSPNCRSSFFENELRKLSFQFLNFELNSVWFNL